MGTMEINVKKIGNAQGSVGWLAAGLAAETIKLTESTLKDNGNHGLWLKIFVESIDGKQHESISQFLAAFNQYGLTGEYSFEAYKYEICDEHTDRDHLWTDAAWQSLMTIAQAWCDQCNAALAAEEAININIIRVSEEG